MAQFPTMVQAALLFDRLDPLVLETLIETFVSLSANGGTAYKRIEAKPGLFYRLFGGDVMVTVEYVGSPAKAQVFEAALGTVFTQMTNPGARAAVARHRSHILVNVHHGALPPTNEISALLAKMNLAGMLQGAQSPNQFHERLTVCSGLALLAHKMGKASLVHWTQTDHLLPGDVFAQLALAPLPSLLHVHPFLFKGEPGADGRDQMTITTFGAKHFVGREIHLAANPMPWHESLGLILTFLKIATAKKGYVIPDNDVFCDEARTLSCRVRHIPQGAKSDGIDGPLYRLELLHSLKHDVTSPDHFTPIRTFDDRTVPADILSDLGREREPVVEDWRTRREMAEGLGGRLVVREPPPPRDNFGPPRVFGRKKPQTGA